MFRYAGVFEVNKDSFLSRQTVVREFAGGLKTMAPFSRWHQNRTWTIIDPTKQILHVCIFMLILFTMYNCIFYIVNTTPLNSLEDLCKRN